jgi:hypothetical protein
MPAGGGRRRALLAGGALVFAIIMQMAMAMPQGEVVSLGEEDDVLLALEAAPIAVGLESGGGKGSPEKQLSRLRNKVATDAKVKKQVDRLQRRKLIDKQVSVKVAKTLAKQMAAKDAATTKVSKAELAKEVLKMKPAFDEKQDIEQLNASREAKKQALASHRLFAQDAHDQLVARSQAGEGQKELPPLPSMQERVKAQDNALKESDSQLLHVSKAELAREMAKIAGAKKKHEAATNNEVDQLRASIKRAEPVSVSDRGNPFRMSPGDKRLIVKRPTIKNLGHAQATAAASQMRDVGLSQAEKRRAAKQSTTHMFTDSTQVKRSALAQAKGMHRLHGAKRKAARIQAEGMKLFPVDERTAQKQLHVKGLSAHDKANAKSQMQIPVLRKGTGQRSAQQQAQMTKLSTKQRRAAALQVKTKLFKISHRNAVGAWRQANSQRLRPSDLQQAASQAKWSPSARAQRAAAVQATEEQLSASQRRAARAQDQAEALSQRDRNQAAAAATPDKLSSSDWQAAHSQAINGKLSTRERNQAVSQSEQLLHQSDALRAVAQAHDAGISKRQQKLSREQARGASFRQVKHFASAQDSSRLFKPTAKIELAARLQTRQYVDPNDLQAAVRQSQGDRLQRKEELGAAKQAARPRLTSSRKAEADRLVHQHGYDGSVRAVAEKQAASEKITLGESVAAQRQASDRLNPKAMKLALRQASPSKMSKKDLKFALRQMKRLYGLSKTQAVDTVTKLTMEARLEALKQAQDRLKKRDAARAKKQAKEIRLSLQDEVAAQRQVTDDKLSHLRKKDEEYAQEQLKSEFAGRLTTENAKIAARLTDKAQKKHEKFLNAFQAWEEAQREKKIRAKYARQREVMLGEAGADAVQAAHKIPSKTATVHRVPIVKPLSGADFTAQLEKIRKRADSAVADIRSLKLKAAGLQL